MRIRIGILFAALVLTLVPTLSACLWTYATNLDGKVEEIMSEPPGAFASHLVSKKSREAWLADADSLKVRSERMPDDYKLRNDIAVALARGGELAEALTILNDIEATKPGLYPTAANLGTVYELHGDVEKALFWIQEGLKRNARSHGGSEWLHVRILKAKQLMADDPDWLKTHSILGLNFGDEPRPTRPAPAEYAALEDLPEWDQLSGHLSVQLRERTSLVEAPDAIISDLLFDLGNVLALNGQLENAIAVDELAAKYEFPRSELLESRLAHFRKVVRNAPVPLFSTHEILTQRGRELVIWLALGLVALLSCIFLWVYRRRKKRTA